MRAVENCNTSEVSAFSGGPEARVVRGPERTRPSRTPLNGRRYYRGDPMLDEAKNLARRLIGTRAKSILRGSWYPMLLPHHQLVDDGISTLGGPVQLKPSRLLHALRLCDGTRTLKEAAWQGGVTAQALIEEDEADIILLWPERPKLGSERGQSVTDGIILSPHLDDAALSLGSMMLRSEHTPPLVVDVFSEVSWWRYPLSDGILPRVQTTRDAEERRVMALTNCALRRWGLSEAPLRGYPLKEIFTAERLPEAEHHPRGDSGSCAGTSDGETR